MSVCYHMGTWVHMGDPAMNVGARSVLLSSLCVVIETSSGGDLLGSICHSMFL